MLQREQVSFDLRYRAGIMHSVSQVGSLRKGVQGRVTPPCAATHDGAPSLVSDKIYIKEACAIGS